MVNLGVFRSIDRFFDVSSKGVAVWTPFIAGQQQMWTATLK